MFLYIGCYAALYHSLLDPVESCGCLEGKECQGLIVALMVDEVSRIHD
jgi:hypothetical protein